MKVSSIVLLLTALNMLVITAMTAHASGEWMQRYGGPSEDVGRSGQQSLDGGYVIVGDR